MKLKYPKITAVEYEEKPVEKIRAQDPTVRVVQGDWHELPKLLDSEFGDEWHLAYSLGKTISYNRRPSEMLHLFDEVQFLLDNEGAFVFDRRGI